MTGAVLAVAGVLAMILAQLGTVCECLRLIAKRLDERNTQEKYKRP